MPGSSLELYFIYLKHQTGAIYKKLIIEKKLMLSVQLKWKGAYFESSVVSGGLMWDSGGLILDVGCLVRVGGGSTSDVGDVILDVVS